MTQKNPKFAREPNSVQEIKKKIMSDLIQWSDELQVEDVVTLMDFDKGRENGIDEALRNRCNLTLKQGTITKKNYFSSKSSCDLRVAAKKTEHGNLRSSVWQCICSKTTAKFAYKPTQLEWRG